MTDNQAPAGVSDAMVEKKIKTSFVYPPIPFRGNDWCAYYDGEEEAGQYGWGETEAAAIEDLRSLDL